MPNVLNNVLLIRDNLNTLTGECGTNVADAQLPNYHSSLINLNMSTDKKEKKAHPNEEKPRKADKVITPPPPQTIDPSASPGEGRNADYKKHDTRINRNETLYGASRFGCLSG